MFIIIVLYNEPPPAPLLYQQGVSWVLCVELNRGGCSCLLGALVQLNRMSGCILGAVCVDLNRFSEFSFGCSMQRSAERVGYLLGAE